MQSDLLRAFPDAPFRVYVVWMPVLPRDSRARWNPAVIDDLRATHFWDPDAGFGRWLHEFAPFRDHPDEIAWDVFALYDPDAVWPVHAPPSGLLASGWTVSAERRALLQAIEPRIRGPWFRLGLPFAAR